MPFAEQMIPSTAIFKYQIGDEPVTTKSRKKKIGKAIKVQKNIVTPMNKAKSNVAKPLSTVNFFGKDFGEII